MEGGVKVGATLPFWPAADDAAAGIFVNSHSAQIFRQNPVQVSQLTFSQNFGIIIL